MSNGITMSWPANQSDAKLLEGGVHQFVNSSIIHFHLFSGEMYMW